MWNYRSTELEIMDFGPECYTQEEYNDCLEQLDKVGKWLGGDYATISTLRKLVNKPQSILDVGCGGGLFTQKLAKVFPQAVVVGIDLNAYAIQYAEQKRKIAKDNIENLSFALRSEPRLSEPSKSFDVVTTTLVCHHIPDEELVLFISDACRVAKKRVVINDLHRHPLAYFFFKLISPIFFRNRLVVHDGPLSIKRAFTYRDWISYLEKIGIQKSRYRVQWHWAFRWIVEIDCEETLNDN